MSGTSMKGPSNEQVTQLGYQIIVALKLWLRSCIRYFTAIYIVILLVISIMVHWYAESNIFTAYLLYVPPLIALIPLGVLFVPSLCVCWRSLIAQLIAAFLFIWLFMGYEMGANNEFSDLEKTRQLRIASFSAGQTGGTKPLKFLNELNPDIIAIQDTGRHGFRYNDDVDYKAWPIKSVIGEYVLLSRHPILRQELIHIAMETRGGRKDVAIAARFIVNWPSGTFCVYSVHMPTPRDILTWYTRRGTFLHGLTPFTEKHQLYRTYWQDRVVAASKLSALASRETHPVVILGDLNCPAHGETYHAFVTDKFDGHREAGSGFGFTFPCSTWNPLALFRPWLRLDQILATKDWKFQRHINERERTTQHRAVGAILRLASN